MRFRPGGASFRAFLLVARVSQDFIDQPPARYGYGLCNSVIPKEIVREVCKNVMLLDLEDFNGTVLSRWGTKPDIAGLDQKGVDLSGCCSG